MNEQKVYDHNKRSIASLFDNHDVFSEFLTKKAAEKLLKRKFTIGGIKKEAYLRISYKSQFDRYLKPGQKLYQVFIK